LLNMREGGRLKDIERISNVKFEKIMIPSAQEVRDKKLLAFTDTIINTEIEEHIFDVQVQKAVDALMELDTKELVQKMLSLELRRFSVDFMNEPDLNASGFDKGSAGKDGSTRGYKGSRIFVSLGKKDGFDIRSFKDWVADASNISWKDLRVDVSGVYSFVDALPEHAQQIIAALNGQQYAGRSVRAELSGDKSSGGGGSYGRGGVRSYGGGGYGGGESSGRGGRSGGGERRSYGGGESSGRSYGGGERRSGGSSDRGGDRRSGGGGYGGGERRSSSEGSSRRRRS